MNHILHVVGTRPNFVKAAPVLRAIRERGIRQTLVHTGQHYDRNMSDVFFTQLEIPEPDFNLEVGSGSHASQTAEIMRRFEPVVLERKPDITLVYGDVNSTVAAALVCSKLLIPVGHVEAGLRSFDRSMPEEVNRVVTDQLSNLLFTPSSDGDQNLRREGIPAGRIRRVGNVMIDTLMSLLPKAMALWQTEGFKRFEESPYVLVTLHRPSNVDDPGVLEGHMQALGEIAQRIRVVFPVHPRTRERIENLSAATEGIELLEPAGYLEFLALESRAAAVITDSGGVQEETTFLGVPCLTVRENTERPITVTEGTNRLVGREP